MNGRIGVESTPGEGSTFWLELPIAEEAPPEPPPAGQVAGGTRPPQARARTILYIEDNLANLNLMERILTRRRGDRLLAAMQASIGLQLARDHHPDLILLDLHLPDMGGDEVLRELQVDPATSGIPVVIISADATPGQVARLVDAGARAYLTKPIDVRQLLSLCESLLGDHA
jgi:CheY-like chemotaxis protein